MSEQESVNESGAYIGRVPESASFSQQPVQRIFMVKKPLDETIIVEREHVRFEGSWVVFSNGHESQVKTEVLAFPAAQIIKVEEITNNPSTEEESE